MTVYNLGISGDTSQDLVIRFENEIKAQIWMDKELVPLISIGINYSYYFNEEKKSRVSQEEYRKNT